MGWVLLNGLPENGMRMVKNEDRGQGQNDLKGGRILYKPHAVHLSLCIGKS